MTRFSILLAVFFSSVPAFALEKIDLPPGFVIEEYAVVPKARSMALGDMGTVFVSTRRSDAVYAVVDSALGTKTIELINDLDTPNGIAFFEGDLYVAEVERITRYADIESHLYDPPAGEVLDVDLPAQQRHEWRYIGFGPDKKLYVAIGAPCNICDEEGFARIIRMNPDGSERETYARGIRNSVGFAWHPVSGELWFTDNGRDMLGDDLPADELNRATELGQHFGYPYCHQGDLPDPKFGAAKRCGDYEAPVYKLGAHVAPLGLRFYSGAMFPEEYEGRLFVAEHGSWNRSKKVGYRIVSLQIVDGVVISEHPFATGWLQDERVSGRPVDLLVLADGSMLVSDDHSGKVYRIRYSGDND